MSCAFPINGFLLTKTVLKWKLIQLAVLGAQNFSYLETM